MIKTEYTQDKKINGTQRNLRVSLKEPINYKNDYSNDKEKWKTINLIPKNDNGNLIINKAPYSANFKNGVNIEYFGKKTNTSLLISLENAKDDVIPYYKDGFVIWENVFNNVDAKIELRNESIQLLLVIKNKNARKKFRWNYLFLKNGKDVINRVVRGKDADNNDCNIITNWTEENNKISVDIEFKSEIFKRDKITRIKSLSQDIKYPVIIDPSVSESIPAGSDDGNNDNYGNWSYSNNYVAANYQTGGYYTKDYKGGLRFTTVNIAQGSTIHNATLSIRTGGLSGNCKIYADDVDSAPAFSNIDLPAGITKTTAYVNTSGLTAFSAETIDVTSIVQEIVNRVGWTSGNDIRLGIFPQADGDYIYLASYENATYNPAALDVTYSLPPFEINVNDVSSVTEDVGINYVQLADVFDNTTISELISIGSTLNIDASDSISVSENISNSGPFVPPRNINVNDSITTSENIDTFKIGSGVHVFVGGTEVQYEYTNSIIPGSLNISNILTRQIDSCKFTIKKYGSSHTFEPSVGEEVFVYIDGIREFGGIITRITQRAEEYKIILFDVECEDYTRLFDRKLIADTFQSKTIEYILNSLNISFLSGFTVLQVDNPDTVINYVSFNYNNASEAFTKLADLLNMDWYIDYYKNIYFISKTSQVAPFTVQDDDGSYYFQSLKIRRDNSQVRNKIFVAGGEYLADTFTTEFISDGTQNVYNLPYKYDSISVTVTGTVWDGGRETIDPQSLYDYLWNPSEKFIRFRGDRIPNSTSNIRVSGEPYLPVRVIVQDSESINNFATAEGGGSDGVYEHIIVDETINSLDGARERASAELTSYKATLSEGTFKTTKAGLRSGQKIKIYSEAHGINEYFLINSVRIRMRNNIEPEYEVGLVTVKTLGVIEFLQGLLRQGKDFTLGSEDIVDVIRSVSETVNISETVTEQALNYDIEFVAGPFTEPSGTKRLFIVNGSVLGRHIHPEFAEEQKIFEYVTINIT